jgi:hypothetical protein
MKKTPQERSITSALRLMKNSTYGVSKPVESIAKEYASSNPDVSVEKSYIDGAHSEYAKEFWRKQLLLESYEGGARFGVLDHPPLPIPVIMPMGGDNIPHHIIQGMVNTPPIVMVNMNSGLPYDPHTAKEITDSAREAMFRLTNDTFRNIDPKLILRDDTDGIDR